MTSSKLNVVCIMLRSAVSYKQFKELFFFNGTASASWAQCIGENLDFGLQ